MLRVLIDENLSESVASRARHAFAEVLHVRRVLGEGASDESIWQFARERNLVLVTRDEDFERLSATRGSPPKIVLVRCHNPRSAEVARLLIDRAERIAALASASDTDVLVLSTP